MLKQYLKRRRDFTVKIKLMNKERLQHGYPPLKKGAVDYLKKEGE